MNLLLATTINDTTALIIAVTGLIGSIAAAIAAIASVLNRRSLRTSNGTTIAQQVEETHKIAKQHTEQLDQIANGSPPETQ